MKKITFASLGISFLISLLNCTNQSKVESNSSSTIDSAKTGIHEDKDHILEYKIVNKKKLETNNKALLEVSAYLTSNPTTKEALEITLKEIFSLNKSEGGYKNFNNPTVLVIYLYTSENMAREMPDHWIAMLTKVPNNDEPRITIDDLKLNSQANLLDNEKSEDEIELEKLNKYLEKRGLELCSLHKQLRDMELDCIHIADSKYPDFGPKHDEYLEKLMELERHKLKKKYHLSDATFSKVGVFGYSYCK